MASAVLKAGFAKTDLTPAVGLEVPGGFYKLLSTGIHDRLWAEAALVSDGRETVAVVGVDLIMVPRDVVDAARAAIEERIGIPARNVLIAASHTHNGGPIIECFGSARDEEYRALVAERIANAVVGAHASALEAFVATGSGHEDSVAFNRRFLMTDGTVKTHPGKVNPDIVRPAGPTDPQVGVIALRDSDGRLLGCIVNYACHGTTLGGSDLSADWVHYLRETVRGGAGAPSAGVIFLNGACGDVTQVDNQSPRPAEFGEHWSRLVGTCVGAEVLKVLARADYRPDAPVAAASEELQLAIRDLGGSDEDILRRESPDFGLGTGVEDVYAREVALVRAMKAASPTAPGEVQALRIGDAGMAANPAEYFCAFGLDIKGRSPAPLTMVAELANGYVGYVPTEDAFAGGGYEVRTARSSYLAPDAGDRIGDAAVGLLGELWERE